MALPNLASGNFCCLALPTRVSSDFTAQISAEVYATTEVPFFIDEWWQKQLGEIEIGVIKECALFLLARSTDPSIDVPFLNSHLHSHYNSLFLQGVGYSQRGVLLGGENSLEGMKVRSIGWLADYHGPPKVVYNAVAKEHLTTNLAAGLETIFARPAMEEYLRLRKGFNAFISGIRQDEAHNRLHQFVRSLDGVIKPPKGEGTNKFKYRCGFFAGRTPPHMEILEDLYELRSAAEHLNPLADKLLRFHEHERDNIKALRSFQSELLASFVYSKILCTPSLLLNFINDETIDAMWSQSASQLIQLWGSTIDLRIAPNGLFFDYL